ncbi:MAG TPA: FAD-dependent monooxygenase [Steroidobacteraceae bacterium]|jgi:2-polyprenyl-6-methoxyphenol hydroxylase-like FAD-dependent oxidoreductase|nr:FAD-dependent monooxygenase [Steroidobacteraceae bacterium]
MHVLIIGAGTGGAALAHALKRAGIGVSVYERDRIAREFTGGYRVGISPAGSRALKACTPPEVYELFVATCARAPRYFNMLTEQFSELLCFELEGEAADAMDGEKNVVRKTLRRVLLTGLEGNVFLGNNFLDYAHNPDGSVTAHFEDGSSATGDVLVGADGSGSRVRKQRLPEARMEDTGIVSLGGKLPMTAQSRALLSEKMFQGMSMIMAPRGMGAIIHSLEFAPNRANPDFAARWPDFIDAIDDDSIGWGLWGARQHFPQDPSALGAEELLKLGQQLTRGWHPHMSQLIKLTEPTMAQFVAVRTSVSPAPWPSSNVTLLGDAIHTMTPGRGAGANTALRDALLLSKVLVDAEKGRKSLLQAIGEYESQMLRYSSEAVAESRKQMNSNDLIHKPVLGRLQLAGMRAAFRVIEAIPPLKRRVLRNIMRVRGQN